MMEHVTVNEEKRENVEDHRESERDLVKVGMRVRESERVRVRIACV
jgi:hypothetical protein